MGQFALSKVTGFARVILMIYLMLPNQYFQNIMS